MRILNLTCKKNRRGRSRNKRNAPATNTFHKRISFGNRPLIFRTLKVVLIIVIFICFKQDTRPFGIRYSSTIQTFPLYLLKPCKANYFTLQLGKLLYIVCKRFIYRILHWIYLYYLLGHLKLDGNLLSHSLTIFGCYYRLLTAIDLHRMVQDNP